MRKAPPAAGGSASGALADVGSGASTAAEGGRFAEVYADATTVWPLLVKAVLEEM